MRPARGRTALAGTFFFALALGANGAPQVVGDEACEKHAIDIEAFATCEGGRVVRPAPSTKEARNAEPSKAKAARDLAARVEAPPRPNATPARQSR